MIDLDALDRLLRTSERILLSPLALVFVLLLALAGMTEGMAVIWKIVKAHNDTLAGGNRALEQIQVGTAVSTARIAESVEAMRGIVIQLGGLRGDVSNHDRDEETRHRETLREIRERDDK